MSFAKFREAARDNPPPSTGDLPAETRRETSATSASFANNAPSETGIGSGSKIVGKLFFEGPVQIDGQIEGEITSKEKLVLGEGAVVNAKVTGSEIWIKGTVNGDIIAARRLVLQRPARVSGNIAAPSLSIEEGVVFEGSCKMSAETGSVRAGASGAASAA